MDRVSAFLHRLIPTANTSPVRTPPSRTDDPVLVSMRNTEASARAAGAAPSPTAAGAPSDPLAGYEMPPPQARILVDLLNQSRRALDPDYGMSLSPHEQAALDHFYSARTALIANVTSGCRRELPVSGAVRAWPDISGCRTQKQILKRILAASPGVIIAEAHWMRASKQLLTDHLHALRRLGVDTVYLEHLQKIHQHDLDRHHLTGQMTPGLSRFLAAQDAGHMTDAHHAGFMVLVKAAQRAGIRVVALDLMTSYHLRGAAFADTGREDATVMRVKVFNGVATQRIAHDQHLRAASGSGRRWVALMGNSHAGSYNGIAGVADRLGVPSLRVEDAGADQGTLLAGFDPGRTLPTSALSAGGDIQCDYLIKVPLAGHSGARTPDPCTAPEARAARQLRVAMGRCTVDLHRAGSYRLVEVEPGEHVLVHRSSSGELVAQRIVAVEGGGLRLQLAEAANPARWTHLDKPFADLAQLRSALNTLLDEVPHTTRI